MLASCVDKHSSAGSICHNISHICPQSIEIAGKIQRDLVYLEAWLNGGKRHDVHGLGGLLEPLRSCCVGSLHEGREVVVK
jgi:hypothetical protein